VLATTRNDTPSVRRDDVQDLDQLAQHLFALVGNPGDVAPRLGQTCDKPVADGVRDAHHDDRYRLRGSLRRPRDRTAPGHDHLDFLPDQFAGQCVQAIHVAIGE